MISDLSHSLDAPPTDLSKIGRLSVALIGPDARRRNSVARGVAGCRIRVDIREFSTYPPSLDDSPKILDAQFNVIFIDVDSDTELALELVESICAHGKSTVMVYSEGDDPDLMIRSMRSGVREFLTLPLEQQTLIDSLVRATTRKAEVKQIKARKKANGTLLPFIGAKPGTGVTTVACNFAVALAHAGNQSTLLIDLDMPYGDAGFNLGLKSEDTVVTALQQSSRLDGIMLSKYVVQHDSGLDVLVSGGRFPIGSSSFEALERLLTVARNRWDNIVLDLGSRLDLEETTLFKDARTIYLVSQAGITELRNANRMIGQFFGSSAHKVEVVMNRYQPRAMGLSEENITKALTKPVKWRISNDYTAVRQMQSTASPIVLDDSPISREIREMAAVVTGQPVNQEKKKKGFGFLSLSKGESGKQSAPDEFLSITRPPTPQFSSEPPIPPPWLDDAEEEIPEPVNHPRYPLILPSAELRTVTGASMITEIFNEAPLPDVSQEETDRNNNHEWQGNSAESQDPEIRVYNGVPYMKGPDGQWHIKETEPDGAALQTPAITWPTPTPIPSGTPLSARELNAVSSIPGLLLYTPSAGYVLPAGSHTLWVTFVPTDTAKHSTAQGSVQITIVKAKPVVLWRTPEPLTHGTALSAKELNATASVPGDFVYSPGVGETLTTGVHTVKATFQPLDTSNYLPAEASVTVTVNKGRPSINWPSPAPITYGTALDATRLNAETSIPGRFVYIPANGSVLAAGSHNPTVVFAPYDTKNYTPARASISLTVTKATPAVAWSAPAPIAYGTKLSEAELNATASVAGNFEYDPPAGTLLGEGKQTLSAIFTPLDADNYTSELISVPLVVVKAPAPPIVWPAPTPITFGTSLGSNQLNATAPIPGKFVYTPPEGAVPAAGTHTLRATFIPMDTQFSVAEATVSLTVNKATPTISWPTPEPVGHGAVLSASQLNATASVPGRFTYHPSAGEVLTAGSHIISVTFTPTAASDYTGAQASVELTVAKAKPTVTWVAPAPIPYGTPLSNVQFNATASVPGRFTFAPAAGTVMTQGTQTLGAIFTPSDFENYTTVQASVPLTVKEPTDTSALLSAADDAAVEEILKKLQLDSVVPAVQPNRLETLTSFVGKPGSTEAFRKSATAENGRQPAASSKRESLDDASRHGQQAELETRVYKGAVYVKGADGQWHLKQK
jgi:Flp pilus assembly CpaE family ATPase